MIAHAPRSRAIIGDDALYGDSLDPWGSEAKPTSARSSITSHHDKKPDGTIPLCLQNSSVVDHYERRRSFVFGAPTRDAGTTVFSAKSASIGYSQTPVLDGNHPLAQPRHASRFDRPECIGKTTLMRALLGSAQVISGEVMLR